MQINPVDVNKLRIAFVGDASGLVDAPSIVLMFPANQGRVYRLSRLQGK
jgi:hypothetical protein